MSAEFEHPFGVIKEKNTVEEDPVHYYRIEDATGTEAIAIGLRPDAFFVGWPTHLDIDQFLWHGSAMITAISSKAIPSREKMQFNPAEATFIMGESESGTILPSYSGLGTNNIDIDGKNIVTLSFKDLEWPLNLRNIEDVVRRKGGEVHADPETNFVRINAEHFSLLFNGERWPRSLQYWSHIYPPNELATLFRDTHATTLSDQDAIGVLGILITPYIDDYYQVI